MDGVPEDDPRWGEEAGAAEGKKHFSNIHSQQKILIPVLIEPAKKPKPDGEPSAAAAPFVNPLAVPPAPFAAPPPGAVVSPALAAAVASRGTAPAPLPPQNQ